MLKNRKNILWLIGAYIDCIATVANRKEDIYVH
jgi:hypothetical protein